MKTNIIKISQTAINYKTILKIAAYFFKQQVIN